jgi:hypothetical protein
MAQSRPFLRRGFDAWPFLERRGSCRNHHVHVKVAWNSGKIVGQKPPLKIKEVWAIRVCLQLAERSRDLALFNLVSDSKLRGCDVVKVGVEDVLLNGTLRSRASVVQQKTGKPVTFEITEQTRSAILHELVGSGGRCFQAA